MDAHTASLAETKILSPSYDLFRHPDFSGQKKRTLNSIKVTKGLDYSGYQANRQEAKGPTERAIESLTNQNEYRPTHRKMD